MSNKINKSPAERTAEFRKLFELAPGAKQIDRIHYVCDVLGYAENTVRVFLIKEPTRAIPVRMLNILRKALTDAGINTA